MVEARGVAIFGCAENRELIENSNLVKRTILAKRGQLEHNWNTAFYSPNEHPTDLEGWIPVLKGICHSKST